MGEIKIFPVIAVDGTAYKKYNRIDVAATKTSYAETCG